MKKVYIALALLVNIILCSVFIQALGVAQEYLEDNTLYLKPGTSRLFTVTLQNEDDEEVKIKFVVASEIITIINPEEYYTIPAKFYDTRIRLNIFVPQDAKIDTVYPINYYVQPMANSDGGMIPLNLRINKQFFVKVIDETQEIEQKIPEPTPIIEKNEQEESSIEQPEIIKKKNSGLNEYLKVALILSFIIILILLVWKKSSLLSIRIIKKKRNKKR